MSSSLASLAVVIYTANNNIATAVYAKGKGKGKGKVKVKVKDKDKDKYNNAISKSILLGCF
jgi:ribosomal protein L31E